MDDFDPLSEEARLARFREFAAKKHAEWAAEEDADRAAGEERRREAENWMQYRLKVESASRPRSNNQRLFDALHRPSENFVTAPGAHTGWALTGRRVPDYPDQDHFDDRWLAVDTALREDIDYPAMLATARTLTPYRLRRTA